MKRNYITEERKKKIEKSLMIIPKATDEQVLTYAEIRGKAIEFATFLAEKCPESREFSIAMTNFETSIMWAINSIARNE